MTIQSDTTQTAQNITIESARLNRNYRFDTNEPNINEPNTAGLEIVFSRNSEHNQNPQFEYTITSGDTTTKHKSTWPAKKKSHTINTPSPTTGKHTQIRVQQQDSLDIDNTYYIHTPVVRSIKTVVIGRDVESKGGPNRWITAALQPHPSTPININTIDPAQTGDLSTQNPACVFLLRPDLCKQSTWDDLFVYTKGGGTLVVFPAPTNNKTWPTDFESVFKLGWIPKPEIVESQPPLGLSVVKGPGSPWDLLGGELDYLLEPVRINTHMLITETINSKPLVAYSDGKPAVVQDKHHTGSVILFGFNLDTKWGNLATKPIIVPMLQELVRTAAQNEFANNNVLLGTKPNTLVFESETRYIEQGLTRLPAGTAYGDKKTNQNPITSTGYWASYDNSGNIGKSFTVNIEPGTTDTSTQSIKEIQVLLGEGWKPSLNSNHHRCCRDPRTPVGHASCVVCCFRNWYFRENRKKENTRTPTSLG